MGRPESLITGYLEMEGRQQREAARNTAEDGLAAAPGAAPFSTTTAARTPARVCAPAGAARVAENPLSFSREQGAVRSLNPLE